jgi:very-short-patch-repair endonuclease
VRGAAADSVDFRRKLRRDGTWAEATLWSALRARQLGAKWRRQHPGGPYVLDFYCPLARVAVELDGDPHFTEERQLRDAERDRYLAAGGIRVLRFTNEQVFRERDAVLECIWAVVQGVQAPPSP